MEGFYHVMNEYKANDNLRRHASPTMRLIKQKNSTWEHKKLLGRNRFDPKYDLCYTTEPGKSYVIEPEGGELDYSQAQKDPIGFYDQVMSQNIT